MTIQIVVKGDKQWDLLGDEYMHDQEVLLVFDDECRDDYIRLRINPQNFDDEDEVIYIEREAFGKLFALIAEVE